MTSAPLSGYAPDNVVTPAAAAAKSGVPVANIVGAIELQEGLQLVTTPNHAVVDPAGDALPSQIIRSA